MHLPLLLRLSGWGTLLSDVAAWGAIHAASGYGVHRLPLERLERDGWLLRPRRFELESRFYTRRLRVQHWKDKLPEAGALFPGGVSKRRLDGDLAGNLGRFVCETRRAERAHWLALAGSPAFALWNPLAGLVAMVTYGVLVNAPFIVVQRFNRQRAQRVMAARSARRP